MTTYLIKAKGAKPKPGHSAAGASTRSSKAAAELLQKERPCSLARRFPSIKIYWPQMSAVQNLVELLDLPQDLLSHQVMEQFTHGTAKQTAEV